MKRILLVDDAAFLRSMCRDFLTKAGFEIAGEAENGHEGIEKYKELNPDIVLLDIAMPECDGITVLKSILSHDPNANIIMLSAIGHARSVIDCLTLGAKDFVVKPFQAESLVKKIRNIIDTIGECCKPDFAKSTALAPIVNLDFLAPFIQMSGDNILAQTEIDTIIQITKSNNTPTAQTMATLMTGVKTTFTSTPKKNESAAFFYAQDDVPVLLHQLLQGQEKMIALLSKLAEK